MPSSHDEIAALEDRLFQADLVTDPATFAELLAPDLLLYGQDGQAFTRDFVIQAHSPAGQRKFSRFEASDRQIRAFPDAAAVSLRIDLEAGGVTHALRFLRLWARRDGRWQVIAASATNIAK